MSSPRHQAAHWFTRLLDLPPDHPDRQAFSQWLAADPRNPAEYQAFSELWGSFSSTAHTQSLASAMEQVSRRRFVRNGALGGLLLAMMAGGVLSGRGQGEQILMTRTGETRRVTLDDGSQIVLDADTHLHVLLGASNRQVYLLRGRAMFSVRHAPTRPFTVDAGAAQVRVLGTRFVVERLAPQVQVSVAEGRVSFASQGASMLLTSDQVGELDGAGHLHRLQRSAASAFSFVEGRLSFEGATLGEIAAALSRYRRVPLQAVQPQAHAITAVVQIADLEHFVTLLPQLAPVSLQTQDGVTLLVPR